MLPIMTNRDVAPDSVLAKIKCSCKTTCVKRCSCKIFGINCTKNCRGCIDSCLNKPDVQDDDADEVLQMAYIFRNVVHLIFWYFVVLLNAYICIYTQICICLQEYMTSGYVSLSYYSYSVLRTSIYVQVLPYNETQPFFCLKIWGQ